MIPEDKAMALLEQWKRSWSDAEQPLYTHLNEIYRLLISLHCPERENRAKQQLAEIYLQRTCEDCET